VLWPRTRESIEHAERQKRRSEIRGHLLSMASQVSRNTHLRRDMRGYLDSYAEGFVDRIESGKVDYDTAASRIRERAEWLMRPEGATATAARIGGAP
jgi:hypothetical protein